MCPSSAYSVRASASGRNRIRSGGEIGPITRKLYDTLTGIQYGDLPDEFGWIVRVD